MNIGVVVLARYNSSRLPGKALKEVCGRPLIQRIVERISMNLNGVPVIVATSEEESDDKISDFCISNNIPVHRGDLENVAQRFLECAEENDLDFAIRINGDNLLVDINLLREIIDLSMGDKYDLITNVPGRTYPYGMSVESVRVKMFRERILEFSKEHLEHVTLFFYEQQSFEMKVLKNVGYPELSGQKFAIDTPEDFVRMEKVLNKLVIFDKGNDYSMLDIQKALNEHD